MIMIYPTPYSLAPCPKPLLMGEHLVSEHSCLEAVEPVVVLCRQIFGIWLPFAVILGIDIEALGISRKADIGLYRSPDATVVEVVPVDALEEWMILDWSSPTANVS